MDKNDKQGSHEYKVYVGLFLGASHSKEINEVFWDSLTIKEKMLNFEAGLKNFTQWVIDTRKGNERSVSVFVAPEYTFREKDKDYVPHVTVALFESLFKKLSMKYPGVLIVTGSVIEPYSDKQLLAETLLTDKSGPIMARMTKLLGHKASYLPKIILNKKINEKLREPYSSNINMLPNKINCLNRCYIAWSGTLTSFCKKDNAFESYGDVNYIHGSGVGKVNIKTNDNRVNVEVSVVICRDAVSVKGETIKESDVHIIVADGAGLWEATGEDQKYVMTKGGKKCMIRCERNDILNGVRGPMGEGVKKEMERVAENQWGLSLVI